MRQELGLIPYTRCTGCEALVTNTKGKFYCLLEVEINQRHDEQADTYLSPSPASKCYKPKNKAELSKAQKMVERKKKRERSRNSH